MYGLQRSSSDSVEKYNASGLVKSQSLPTIPNKSSPKQTFKTKLLTFTVSPQRLGQNKSSDTLLVRDPTGKIAKLIPLDPDSIDYNKFNPFDSNIIKDVLSGKNKNYIVIWLEDV